MLRSRLAVLSFALAGLAGISGACGDDGAPPPEAPDSGVSVGAVGDGICPATAPAPGEVCLLPQGTTCAFGQCGTAIAQCLYGVWLYGGNPAPKPVCPGLEPPAEGTACPPCWPPAVVCRYGSLDCTSPDASANTTVATCPAGVWTLQYAPCGSLDAGADHDAGGEGGDGGDGGDGRADGSTNVQGDADPDAD